MTNHQPDYSTHCYTPVQSEGKDDIVIFACACGSEDCTWQVLIPANRRLNFDGGIPQGDRSPGTGTMLPTPERKN